MSIGKGAREFKPAQLIELEGDVIKVNIERNVLPTVHPMEKDEHGQAIFKKGDIIRVMPPDRVSKEGWDAEVLEVTTSYCKYRLLETSEIFHVSKVVLVNTPRK